MCSQGWSLVITGWSSFLVGVCQRLVAFWTDSMMTLSMKVWTVSLTNRLVLSMLMSYPGDSPDGPDATSRLCYHEL